jgi:hypothetical protein
MDSSLLSILERAVSAAERFVDAYEAYVANQSRMVEQTIRTMDLAQSMAVDELKKI